MEKLTQEQIDTKLEPLPEWSKANEILQRTFAFEAFTGAMTFVNQIADLAERVQHHPDILIRYNKVTLSLSTHDAGGITDKDFDFAVASEELMTVKA